MRSTSFIAAVVMAVLCAVPAASAAPPPSPSPVQLAAGEPFAGDSGSFARALADPSSYWRAPRLTAAYTPEVWQLLHDHGTVLTFHLRWGRDFGPVPPGEPRRDDALPLLRAAAEHGVPVSAWLVLPYTDGYWATQRNADMWQRVLDDFVAWTNANDLHPQSVQLDLEADIRDTVRLTLLRRDPGAVVRTGWLNLRPRGQCRAAATYAGLVRWGHDHGLEMVASAYPMFVDDMLNGDAALASGLGLPYVAPGVLDDVGFMTMRSVYLEFTGIDPGPSLQVAYARDIRRRFGPTGSLSLGVAGVPPYTRLATVVQDIRVAAALGSDPIGLYSLETTVQAFGADGLRAVLDAGRDPLPAAELDRFSTPSAGTRIARAVYQTADAALGLITPAAALANEGRAGSANRWPAGCG